MVSGTACSAESSHFPSTLSLQSIGLAVGPFVGTCLSYVLTRTAPRIRQSLHLKGKDKARTLSYELPELSCGII